MADAPSPARAAAPAQPRGGAFAALAGVVGLALASTLVVDTRGDEGVKHIAYRDLGGVWTVCSGSTHGVQAGEADSDDQCDARTAADLTISARAVLRCAPGLGAPERQAQLRAAIRFQNNTGHFCSSSAARLMAARQWKAGCDALLAWDGIVAAKPIAGAARVRRMKDGRYFSEMRGLMNRRANEHAICIQGL